MQEKQARRLFDALEGAWALHRTIQPAGRFDGTARFERVDANTLQYRERGMLSLPDGPPIEGTREYIYRLEGDRLCAYFPEEPPRLFQCMELQSAADGKAMAGEAKHRCAADDYNSSYEFHSDGTFRIVHEVKGPRKNYTLVTEYEPLEK